MADRGLTLRRLEAELSELAGAPVELERPSKDEHGDYATNVALRAAPTAGKPPRELAEELAGRVGDIATVERAEVAGPGFLNLWLEPAWFGEALAEILEAGAAYGAGSAETKERVQVELVSANPTGPLTVGSGRNGAYGDSVARLLELAGHEVEREYYYNDVGRQIDLFRESVEARRRGEEPPEDGYSGAYVEEIAAREGDPVELMTAEIRSELEQLRIHIETWMRQADIEAEIPLRSSESTRTRRRARSGRERRRSATTRTGRSSALPTGAISTSRPTWHTCSTSSPAASTAPSTCSAPITTATSSG